MFVLNFVISGKVTSFPKVIKYFSEKHTPSAALNINSLLGVCFVDETMKAHVMVQWYLFLIHTQFNDNDTNTMCQVF